MYIHSSLAGAKLRSTTMYGTSGIARSRDIKLITKPRSSAKWLLLHQLYPFVWVLEPCAVLLANMDTPWFSISHV